MNSAFPLSCLPYDKALEPNCECEPDISRPTSAPQIPLLGLESWLGSWEHLLLFQRTWGRRPALSWKLTAVHNTSLRGSDALFSPQWVSRKHMECIHTCRQNTHGKKIKINVKQHFHTTNEDQMRIDMYTCVELGHSSKSRTVCMVINRHVLFCLAAAVLKICLPKSHLC